MPIRGSCKGALWSKSLGLKGPCTHDVFVSAQSTNIYIYIYIYICVCVCVCVGIGTTLIPKYMLYQYMEVWGKASMRKVGFEVPKTIQGRVSGT